MSTAYAIIMLAVTVGIVVQTSQDSWTSPNAMFIIVITAIFVLAGLLHPEEFMCLMPGVLYFLCIPSGEVHHLTDSIQVGLIQISFIAPSYYQVETLQSQQANGHGICRRRPKSII